MGHPKTVDSDQYEWLLDSAKCSLRQNTKRREALDRIKVRAYELGVKEIHDMALKELQEIELDNKERSDD